MPVQRSHLYIPYTYSEVSLIYEIATTLSRELSWSQFSAQILHRTMAASFALELTQIKLGLVLLVRYSFLHRDRTQTRLMQSRCANNKWKGMFTNKKQDP
jgi:hypothetical protein